MQSIVTEGLHVINLTNLKSYCFMFDDGDQVLSIKVDEGIKIKLCSFGYDCHVGYSDFVMGIFNEEIRKFILKQNIGHNDIFDMEFFLRACKARFNNQNDKK